MISRRKFLGNSLMVTAALPAIASQPFHFFKNDSNKYINEIGLQLYTVREQMAKDPEGTLKAIQAIGYKQVEGGNIRAFDQFLPKVQAAGLVVKSTGLPSAFITERWDLVEASGGQKPSANYTTDSIIENAVKSDVKYLMLGYLQREERQTIDDYKRIAENLNAMGEKCNQADIYLCYHNHSFEFKPMDGIVPFEVFLQELESDKVFFELDVFWISVAGKDPVKFMEELDGRVKLLHLKDKKKGVKVIYDESKVKKDAFQELGDGVLDIAGILQTAEKIGVEQCFVEQDHSSDPIASIKQSYNYLKEIEGKL